MSDAARADLKKAEGGRLILLLRDAKMRNWFWQLLLVAAIAAAAWFLVDNTLQNLARRNMASGLDFLSRTAGFDIEQSPIRFSATDSYARALLVGICNTILAAAISIVCATLLGFVVAMMRMSTNLLSRATAGAYVEFLRNTPAILQIIFWYFAVLAPLPPPRQSIDFGGIAFLNVRGLFLPKPIFSDGGVSALAGLAAAIVLVAVVLFWHRSRSWSPATGAACLAMVVLLPAAAMLFGGEAIHWEVPALRGFNFAGGIRLFPEFIALTLGLSVYTSSFIAEIIRAGFNSVGKGQVEAARSLGLRPLPTLYLIKLPLALRVIIPPLTSQYLSLVKNTSLAVAIGYPEIVQIFAGTVLNQSGQAIEVMAITMLIYLGFSLGISVFMNWYNRRVALVER